MNTYDWDEVFHRLYDKAVKQYQAGNLNAAAYFDAAETAFLASIGHTAQEVFDFAEDACKYGEPSFGTALMIASVRRDYFLVIQKGQSTGRTIRVEDLPAKDAAVEGIAWLPRIIAKAHAKLRGEMPPDLMFGCGGDRKFLKSVGIHPADFLRHVWAVGNDDAKVIAHVKKQAGQA